MNGLNPTLRDAVYGAVIGDALGVPYEFLDRGTFECTGMAAYGTHHQPAGTWSDDSSLLLATCRSLKDCGGKIDTADILEKFRQWYYEGAFSPFGEVFDIGGTTRTAIVTGEPVTSGHANGNGSLMRILPLAFTDCTDDEIRAVSAVTHGHWISTEACVIFVHLMRDCMAGKSLEEAVRALDCPEPFDRLTGIAELPESEISSGGYVVSTLEAAIWCVLNSSTYPECLLKAVNLGDDSDTTACVAGTLGAVKFPFTELPEEWVAAVQNRELIEECLF